MTQHILQLKTFAGLFSILTVLSFIIWSGCSTTTLMHPSSNDELNAQLKGHDAIVEMKEGMELSVKEVHVTNDSVSWLDRETNIESRTGIGRLSKIKTINKNDHVLGALEGLGIGFVGTGLGVWLLSGFSTAPGRVGSALDWAAIFGLGGGGIGLLVGAIAGFTYYDEFQLDEQNVSKGDSLKSHYKGVDSLSTIHPVAVPETPVSTSYSQDLCDSCFTIWDERPKQIYNLLFLTNIGVFYSALPADEAGVRGVADFGGLLIIGAGDAIGGSVLGLFDNVLSLDIVFSLAFEFRYRRRLDSKQSIDLGLGFPIYGEHGSFFGSFYGLVKWNPIPWLGIALRPEMRRSRPIFGSVSQFTTPNNESRFHLSIGIEIGGSVGR